MYVITGGAGFIGSNIAAALEAAEAAMSSFATASAQDDEMAQHRQAAAL